MRSKYIYIIRYKGDVISAHTVLKEAEDWIRLSAWKPSEITVHRVRDGLGAVNSPFVGRKYKCQDELNLKNLFGEDYV